MAQNYQVTNLDFDTIKETLINYLKTKPEFTDMDFSGSNLQALINVLAYNTHYNGILTNAAFNETFLDTAIKRGSVVSRANEFGYVPKSARSSTATVAIDIQNQYLEPLIVTIPEYHAFTSTFGSKTYTFYTIKAYSASIATGKTFAFPGLELHEGKKLVYAYTATGNVAQKFIIPNIGVDTSTIRVLVRESSETVYQTKFTEFVDLTNAAPSATVYYLEQNPQGFYQISFGDGVLSKAIASNSVVTIDYIVPSGSSANVSAQLTQTFLSSGAIDGVDGTVVVRTLANSAGGADEESTEEVRFNSRLSFERQNRIITSNDFVSFIMGKYGNIKSVSVYGGDQATPPVYGKVFICLQPNDNVFINDTMKTQMKQDMKAFMNMAVTPVFIDPDYIYINLNCSVKYDQNRTTINSGALRSNIMVNIENYFGTNISKFKGEFYYSQLIGIIGDTDPSILSTYAVVSLQKRLSPLTSSVIPTTPANFGNKIKKGSLYTNVFYTQISTSQYQAKIIDDSNGNLVLISATDGTILTPVVGSINYVTGECSLNNLIVNSYVGSEVYLKVNVVCDVNSSDITPLQNQILVLDDSTFNSDTNIQSGVTISLLNGA